MQFNESAFKKATKRLAAIDDSTLSVAQEKLASIMGFANLDAALKAFKALKNGAPPVTAATRGRMWRDLNCRETCAFLRGFLFNPSHGGVAASGDWLNRAEQLLITVTVDIFSRPNVTPVAVADIMDAIDIDKLGTYCFALRKNGETLRPAQKRLIEVLSNTPGFSWENTQRMRGQNESTKEQYGYLRSIAMMALISLETFESLEESSSEWGTMKSIIKSNDFLATSRHDNFLLMARKIEDLVQFPIFTFDAPVEYHYKTLVQTVD